MQLYPKIFSELQRGECKELAKPSTSRRTKKLTIMDRRRAADKKRVHLGTIPTTMSVRPPRGTIEGSYNHKKKATLAWIRNIVAQLHLTGQFTGEDISAYMMDEYGIRIPAATVRTHIGVMRKAWQAQAMQDTNSQITEELARLSQLEQYAINTLRDGGLRVSEQGTFIQIGDSVDFCNIMLKISKRRSTLMGLDKAQKITLTDARTSELSDEELEAIIRQAKSKEAEE
jgi:hypothetical protein